MSRDDYLQQFERSAKGGVAAALRRRAIDRFAALGFPTGREEEWRFTDVSPIEQTVFATPNGAADPARLSALAKGPLRDCQLAFVNGRYAQQFSSLRLPAGVVAGNLASFAGRVEAHLGAYAAFDRNPFAALNTAFMADGAFVSLPKGAVVEAPIHLLFLSTAAAGPYVTYPRVLIVAEEGANATVVESYLGPDGGVYLTNAVTEIVAGDGSAIVHCKIQREAPQAYHVASIQVRQGRGTAFTSHSISLGAAIARNDIGTVLDGEGAECSLNGLFEAAGQQLVDHHTCIDHARPHGTSRELYKGILDGRARGVFDGRIIVRPDAQKTNAVQTNKNLLLSPTSLVNTKPELQIFANDVKCKHGATVGQLDRDVLFYLRSRGIGLDDARRLLIHAFAGEIVDQVKVEAVREQIGGCLHLLAGGRP